MEATDHGDPSKLRSGRDKYRIMQVFFSQTDVASFCDSKKATMAQFSRLMNT